MFNILIFLKPIIDESIFKEGYTFKKLHNEKLKSVTSSMKLIQKNQLDLGIINI